jgi:hypothetical protein
VVLGTKGGVLVTAVAGLGQSATACVSEGPCSAAQTGCDYNGSLTQAEKAAVRTPNGHPALIAEIKHVL